MIMSLNQILISILEKIIFSFIFALKVGELSQIFPMLALNFIWVALAAVFIFGETLTTIRILATILIAIGVLFVGSNS